MSSPDGRAWEVDVHWTGRQLRGRRLERARAHVNRKRQARTVARAKRKDGDKARWFDFLDVVDLDFDGLVVVSILVVFVAALVFGAPIMSFLALDLLEVLFFPMIALVLLTWRAARGSAFALTAACEGVNIQRWQVKGVRTARAMERAIADALVAGGQAETLFHEDRVDAVSGASSHDPGSC